MAGEWYYQMMGEVVGPLSADELRSHAAEGEIQRDTTIRKGENGAWVLADTVRGLFDRESRARVREDESTTLLPRIKFENIQEVEPPQVQTPTYYRKICSRFQNFGYACAVLCGLDILIGSGVVFVPDMRMAGVSLLGIGIASAVGCLFYAWMWEVVSGYFDMEQQNLDLLRELVANTRRTTTTGSGKE